MPVQCPQGIPQSVCDAAGIVLANQGVNPQTWDASNVATTFQQWYAQMSQTKPLPPVPPTAAGFLSTPDLSTLLGSALTYWTGVASKNPGIGGQIPPATWTLPWQYVNPQQTDPLKAVTSMILNAAKDPSAAQQILSGKLPPFDPTRIDWTKLGQMPIADSQTWGPVATGAASYSQPAQDFMAKAASCGLLQASQQQLLQAWNDFLAGKDPCAQPQPQPAPLPPLPAPAPVPAPSPAPVPVSTTTTITSPPTETPWGMIVVGTAAVIGTGLLVYYLSANRGAPAASENPYYRTRPEHYKLKSGYAYVYSGKRWKTSSPNSWDTEVVTPTGHERFVGLRQIDGSMFAVFLGGDGRYYAELEHYARA